MVSDGHRKYERYRAEVAERKTRIENEVARSKGGGLSRETRRRIEAELKLL